MILTINAGSSSIRATLYKGNKLKEIVNFHIDKIGSKKSIFSTNNEEKFLKINNHTDGINIILSELIKQQFISDYSEITAIGHRIVHGGEKYSKPTIITSKVIKEIEKLSILAPLHNPENLKAVIALQELLPNTTQIAIFDTAFHQSISEKAYRYAIPNKFYKKHKIRRYGFHGISHKFVVEKTQKLLKKKNAKIITCHLGNGASITASLNGKSIDTSMGLTPLEGLLMGTRCGSIDPSIPLYMQETLNISAEEVSNILNKESGLKAVSKISNDMRDIYATSLKKYSFKNKSAKLAIEMLSYQIAKTIGSYAAALGGVDAITFTATLGEKAFYVREQAIEQLKFLGAHLNKKANIKNAETISSTKSKVKIFVLKTNEELEIAKQVLETI